MFDRKRGFSSAFPTLSTYAAAGQAVYNAFKRFKTGYSLIGSDRHPSQMGKFKSFGRFRRRYGTRTITKRRRFRRRNSLYRKIKRINRRMFRKGLNSVEVKYNQGNWQGDATNSAGTYQICTLNDATGITNQFSPTTGITKGNNRSNRQGNKVFIRNFRFRGWIEMPESPTANCPREIYVRFLVIRVKAPAGAGTTLATDVPFVNGIFDCTSASATSPGTPLAGDSRLAFWSCWKWYNVRYMDNYTILYDRTFKVATETGGDMFKKKFRANIKVNKPCYYNDSDQAQEGNIYMYWWADQVAINGTVVSGDRVLCGGNWRITWTDV